MEDVQIAGEPGALLGDREGRLRRRRQLFDLRARCRLRAQQNGRHLAEGGAFAAEHAPSVLVEPDQLPGGVLDVGGVGAGDLRASVSDRRSDRRVVRPNLGTRKHLRCARYPLEGLAGDSIDRDASVDRRCEHPSEIPALMHACVGIDGPGRHPCRHDDLDDLDDLDERQRLIGNVSKYARARRESARAPPRRTFHSCRSRLGLHPLQMPRAPSIGDDPRRWRPDAPGGGSHAVECHR